MPRTGAAFRPRNVDSPALAAQGLSAQVEDLLQLLTDLSVKRFYVTAAGVVVVNEVGAATAAALELRGDAGQRKQLDFLTGTSMRWRCQTTVGAESGGNVGTDWQVGRFDDTGASSGTPLKIFRSTGHVYLGPNLAIVVSPGAAVDSTLGGAVAALFVADGTAPSSNVAGGSMVYSQGGELKHRNPSGVVSNITPPATGGSGSIITKTKAADQASTLIATTDITDLTHAVAASTRYHFSCMVRYVSAAAGTGLSLGVNGPVGTTVSAAVQIAETATTVRNGSITALDGKVQALASAGATEMIAWVRGTILVGSVAGTLAMRFGTEVAASSVTIKAGSTLDVWT